MGNYQLNDIFSVRGELGYTIMGTEAINIYTEGNYSYSYGIMERYNCAQIIFAGQATYNTRILSGYLFIGPYLTHRFGGRGLYYDVETTEELDIVWVEGYSYYIYDGKLRIGELNNRRYDFGLYAGAGIGKELGKGRIDLGLSFGAGLVDLHKFVNPDHRKSARQNGYKSFHNLNLNVTLSYWFHIRKDVE